MNRGRLWFYSPSPCSAPAARVVGTGPPGAPHPTPLLSSCRYEDEINKRTAAENEFVVLKKVSRTRDNTDKTS